MEETSVINKKITLFNITWPIFIELFLQMSLTLTDTFMLGHYSDNAVAAVGTTNQIFSVITMVYGIISSGAIILVSQYLGAGKKKNASEVAAVAFGVNLVFGLFLSLILFLFGRHILVAMNLPKEVIGYASQFLRIVGGFSFVQALFMTMSAVIRSYGHTKVSMYVAICMNILNVAGDYMMLFGPWGIPSLGVTGVAISTTVSRGIALAVLFVILVKHLKIRLPFEIILTFPKETLKNILGIGMPSAGETISYNVAQVVVTSFIATLGAEALSARTYTSSLQMFVMLMTFAMGQGSQILIGYMVGANRIEEAYKACIRNLKIGVAASLGMAILFAIIRKPLLGMLTSNQTIIALASPLLLITILLEPGRAFNLIIINCLKGSGDVKFPVFMGAISMWGVSVMLSYLLGIYFRLGLIGVWIAFCCDEWTRGILMLWRWRSRVWERMSFVNVQPNENIAK